MSILSIICLIGIAQTLFLTIFISLRKEFTNKKIRYFFYGLLFVFLVNLVWKICYEENLFDRFWFLLETVETTSFLYGPLLLFILKCQFEENYKIKLIHFLHFVPALLYFLFYSPVFFGNSTTDFFAQFNITIVNLYSFPITLDTLFYIILWRLHFLIYSIILLNYLYNLKTLKFSRSIKNNSSLLVRFRANKTLVFSYFANFLIGFSDLILNAIFDLDFQAYFFTTIILVIHIFITSYIIFLDINLLLNPLLLLKKRHTNLSKIDVNVLKKNIEEVLINQKQYLNADLSLSKLAKSLSVTTHQLSEYFNDKEKLSFNNYVNQLRVAHSKKLLLDPMHQKYTLVGIAQESGFKSLSTFHRNFKKHTSLTPNKWLELRRINNLQI